jgi:hypothetical protein
MSEMMKGQNNHMFNKEVTSETRAKISTNIRKAISDPIICTKLSKANSGTKNPNFGKIIFTKILAKMSIAQGTIIFVYDPNNSFVNTFSLVKEAEKYFNCSLTTIKKYILIG